MKPWIVGKNGLLGSTLANRLPDAIASRREEADVADLASLQRWSEKHRGITHIFNCAAYSLVDAAETEQDAAWRANALGPENLGRLARDTGARLIHISTDYVFPGDLNRPLREDDPTSPLNHYGRTKLEGEQRLFAIFPDALIVRVSWLFGEGGKNFVSKLLAMMQSQEEICLTDDHWGRPTYTPDLAGALLALSDCSGLFHFANQGSATKYSFGCFFHEEAKRQGWQIKTKKITPVSSNFFPSPCERPPYSVFDTTKIERILGPIRPWQAGIPEFLCRRSAPLNAFS